MSQIQKDLVDAIKNGFVRPESDYQDRIYKLYELLPDVPNEQIDSTLNKMDGVYLENDTVVIPAKYFN